MNEHLDPTSDHLTPESLDIEKALRPLSFNDFTGQDPSFGRASERQTRTAVGEGVGLRRGYQLEQQAAGHGERRERRHTPTCQTGERVSSQNTGKDP